MYAQRGARVCVVGRRKREVEEVELECKTIQRIKESEEDRNAFSFCADFADPGQMVMLRDVIQAGKFVCSLVHVYPQYGFPMLTFPRAQNGKVWTPSSSPRAWPAFNLCCLLQI